MRDSDTATIEKYVPSLELMYRAAMGVYLAVQWHGHAAIVVGSGNNGGDGFALACILREKHIPCTVYTVSSRFSPDSAHYAAAAETAGVAIQSYIPGCLQGYDIIVDCLLGTGFQGTLKESYRLPIEEINASGAYVVSVDINSGMNGDSGQASLAVHSNLTVTIGYVKNGLVTECAGRYIKKLVCADIGIVLSNEENWICNEEEWKALCSSLDRDGTEKAVTIEGITYCLSPSWMKLEAIKAY